MDSDLNNFELPESGPKKFISNFGNVVTMVIVFIAFSIMTTDLQLTSIFEWATIGLTFFVILILSNLVYLINFSSAVEKAKEGEIYLEAKAYYEEQKKSLMGLNWAETLELYCSQYVKNELERTRKVILSRVGIHYDTYMEKYISKSKKELKKEIISKSKIKAILKANSVKPITLTPEMIYNFGGKDGTIRHPLGLSPGKKSTLKRVGKVVTSFATSFLSASIALRFVLSPSWEMFCLCLTKLLPIIYNWYVGRRDGKASIENDLAPYVKTQADLMSQAINYVHTGQKMDNILEEAL